MLEVFTLFLFNIIVYNIPLLYGTTREFLKKFGFTSLKDLPEVPEYEELRREREEQGGQLFMNFDAEEVRRFLDACEDAEDLGGGEYTVDLYDVDTPVSMDILFDKKGVDVLAALELLYDEGEDGWYLGEKIKDADRLTALLNEALA